MEMSQGNSLYTYLKQKNVFFFFKIREQEGREQILSGEIATSVGVGRCRESV
jgi:hypothetical protein